MFLNQVDFTAEAEGAFTEELFFKKQDSIE
jgi:hypothetical protein